MKKGWPLLALTLSIGCTPTSQPGSKTTQPEVTSKQHSTSTTAQASETVEARELVTVPAGTLGPYLGRSGDQGVLVWVQTQSEKREWRTLPLSGGNALTVAEAPDRIDLISVRPSQTGYTVVSTRRGDDFHAVEAFALGKDGALLHGPRTLSEGKGRVAWIDSVATRGGSLVTWASVDKGIAAVRGVRFTPADDSSAHTLLADCLAWQLAGFDGGAALAAVTQSGDLRTVQVSFVAADGTPAKDPLVVQTRGRVQLDLDMVAINDGLVLGWSQEQGLESALMSAAIDRSGLIRQAPKPLTAPRGEQTLVRLVPPFPGAANGYAAWEDLRESPPKGRRIKLAPLLEDAQLGSARGVIEMRGDAPTLPEFQASAIGLGALTQYPLCEVEKAPCEGARLTSVFALFDPRLELFASGPLWLSAGTAPTDLAWSLGCSNASCNTLVADRKSPTPISLATLGRGSTRFLPPGATLDEAARPSIISDEAIIEVDPIADIAISRSKPANIVTWLTDFDPTLPYERPKVPAPDGRYAPVRALLEYLGPHQKESAAISIRARSLGGVALAQSPAEQTLVAWSAIDNNSPQVFLTMLDATGKKRLQRMLTRTKAGVADVAASWGDNSWIVAWADERDGDSEVYAAKVAEGLVRIGNEQRITKVPGVASDLVMLRLENSALLVWGDTRGAERQGWADIFSTTLSLSNATASSLGTRLARTDGHSHSPSLTAFKGGAALTWIESRTQETSLAFAQLDPSGNQVGETTFMPTSATVSGVDMHCTNDICRVVFSQNGRKNSELWTAIWEPGTPPTAKYLGPLTGPPSQRVEPRVAGDTVIYADQTRDGETRLRRMYLRWE